MNIWTEEDVKYVREYLTGVFGRPPTNAEVREALINWI